MDNLYQGVINNLASQMDLLLDLLSPETLETVEADLFEMGAEIHLEYRSGVYSNSEFDDEIGPISSLMDRIAAELERKTKPLFNNVCTCCSNRLGEHDDYDDICNWCAEAACDCNDPVNITFDQTPINNEYFTLQDLAGCNCCGNVIYIPADQRTTSIWCYVCANDDGICCVERLGR